MLYFPVWPHDGADVSLWLWIKTVMKKLSLSWLSVGNMTWPGVRSMQSSSPGNEDVPDANDDDDDELVFVKRII